MDVEGTGADAAAAVGIFSLLTSFACFTPLSLLELLICCSLGVVLLFSMVAVSDMWLAVLVLLLLAI